MVFENGSFKPWVYNNNSSFFFNQEGCNVWFVLRMLSKYFLRFFETIKPTDFIQKNTCTYNLCITKKTRARQSFLNTGKSIFFWYIEVSFLTNF